MGSSPKADLNIKASMVGILVILRISTIRAIIQYAIAIKGTTLSAKLAILLIPPNITSANNPDINIPVIKGSILKAVFIVSEILYAWGGCGIHIPHPIIAANAKRYAYALLFKPFSI